MVYLWFLGGIGEEKLKQIRMRIGARLAKSTVLKIPSKVLR